MEKLLGEMMLEGPCVICGETGYSLSLGGPSICPSCDCGISPEVAKLKKQIYELARENAILRGLLKSADGYMVDHDENNNVHKAIKTYLYS